ncbi:hypothetical protein WJX72_008426 [[Myrmecia] bisecta]|uniref:Uncharacterized protein n=1 Tax=[Myrmecia] bisecta TaxID=41462 RepID=A0AAW1PB49_9CHLO
MLKGLAGQALRAASQLAQRNSAAQQRTLLLLKPTSAPSLQCCWRSAVRRTGEAVNSLLPAQARQWLKGVQQPGSIQKAASLQVEAFWQHHRRKVFVAAGVVGVYFLWRTLFGITSVFVNLSGRMAEWGFLAFAAAVVAFSYLYIKRLYTINPDSVYRLAMLRLNTNPGALEVLGAPLAGSDVRAMTMTGGGIRFRGLRPSYRSRRLQMIFPLRGSERRGLVSLEAKKRKGHYNFKLLAVDVSPELPRLFLEGNQQVYDRGGVLGELRDPFLKAVALQETHDAEDEIDDAADDAEAANAQRVKEAQAVKRKPKSMDDGGGLYFYERLWLTLRRACSSATKAPQPAS